MINFNVPPYIDTALEYISRAFENQKISGDGEYTKKCSRWITERFSPATTLLTTSCTHALEMSAILSGIKPGDEIIMPSYTFSSTANAFVLHGAKIVFIDIRPDTLNINENLIEQAITDKTKAIVVVHYAGVACEMDYICDIAKARNIIVIEDAAQAIMSSYKNRACGTLGLFGCFSFHETKNYSMGEGGALLINDPVYIEHAEIIREKGTNRSKFHRGMVDKYTWIDAGSSFLPSDINAAYLWAQLEVAEKMNNNRLASYNTYFEQLKCLCDNGKIELPYVPDHCMHNAHMFYIKLSDINERDRLIKHLKSKDILAVFHYIPLHNAPAGKKYGRFHGEDKYTTIESERILRLPMYYGLKPSDVEYITDKIKEFYH